MAGGVIAGIVFENPVCTEKDWTFLKSEVDFIVGVYDDWTTFGTVAKVRGV